MNTTPKKVGNASNELVDGMEAKAEDILDSAINVRLTKKLNERTSNNHRNTREKHSGYPKNQESIPPGAWSRVKQQIEKESRQKKNTPRWCAKKSERLSSEDNNDSYNSHYNCQHSTRRHHNDD